ncbi:hypothetical protein ACFW04_010336 [Cataglyphis niger]
MNATKKFNNPNPRASANPISKLFFWWLVKLFWYGKDHDLEMKNLYDTLPADVSELLGNSLEQVLQPYLLGLLIWHFDPRAISTQEEAYFYATGVIIIGIMTMLINHHSYVGLTEIGMRVRIASSSLMYRKILRLSKSSTTTPGQIINLLSNDMSKFDQLFTFLHYIWIMPIQGAIIAYLIWQNVGIASLTGISLITIQTIPLQGYISKWISKLRLKTAIRTDERIRLMSEIISGIQVIKMYTWEKPFQELVNCIRKYEIDVLTLMSYLRGFTLATFVFTERTTLYFTILTYVLFGYSISADKVFSMAQYFNILQLTMAIFYPLAVASVAETAVSIKRIESSFLQAILGELEPSHGQIYINGKISYASQEPWLFADTVRNNILFDQPYNKDKYQRVVKICALVRDFAQLPYGDKTFVGERGTALSGGQRARINLARAVYRDANIYLFDDPLSAVDTNVGRHLFDECINNYLQNKTRILVTHQLQYLKQCDYIIILNNAKIMDMDFYFLDTNTALWIYGGFLTISVVMTTCRNLIFYKICMNASKNLHNFMFSCLLKAPMSFFDNNPSGRILNRFSKDIGTVDEILPRTTIEAIQIFVVMIGILIQVLIINWWIIFPTIIMGILYNEIKKIYIPTAQTIKRLEGNAKSPVFSHVNSTLSGLTTIRSAGAQEIVRKQFDEHQDLHTSTYSLIVTTSTMFGFALDMVTIGFIAFVTFSFVVLNNENTFAGNVGLAISQVLILCGMMQYGIRQTAETITQMTSVERILQFTELEKESPFESNPTDKPPSNWPVKGEIKFDRVSLQYAKSEPPVLKSLSFIIEPGMKIGIVGRTGAGKSSLISALFHMTKFDGDIYIDKVNTKKIGLHDLRNKISIIPQEPMLFSATLRDNLDPFRKFHDADLWSALEEVQLKDAIASLNHGIEHSGSNLSAGQRQLICLARAILQDNRILVLDEATANVDPTTDALIQTTIRNKFKACTVLTIAHRLNTIMDSDKVLLMDHGQMLEFDHPYILLQNEKSHFSAMVQETGKLMTEQLKQCAKQVN